MDKEKIDAIIEEMGNTIPGPEDDFFMEVISRYDTEESISYGEIFEIQEYLTEKGLIA